MREIKFRSAHYDYKGNFIHFSHWGYISRDGESTRDEFCSPCSSSGTQRKAEEQYTGLKDRNGVEIYEGDVLDIHRFIFDGNEVEIESKGYMVFNNALAAFAIKFIENGAILEHTGYKSYEEMPSWSLSELYGIHEESFEVIGNIHENPELVK